MFKKTRMTNLIAGYLFVVLSLLFFSVYSSPVYPYTIDVDQALFEVIGKGIVNGRVVYRDLFDHKGPIMFFIQAIGKLVSDKTGIFIVQCLFAFFDYFLFYQIWLIKRKNHSFVFPFLCTYAAFFWFLEGGNLCEEYSLPFILFPIFLFLKYSESGDVKHPPLYSLFYGMCFSILAFMKLNDAVSIAAGVFVIVILLIKKKEWKNLFINIVFGVIGCVIVTMPICFYFTAVGGGHYMR